jgi:hypothetical protein
MYITTILLSLACVLPERSHAASVSSDFFGGPDGWSVQGGPEVEQIMHAPSMLKVQADLDSQSVRACLFQILISAF